MAKKQIVNEENELKPPINVKSKMKKRFSKFRSIYGRYIVIFCVREGNSYEFLKSVRIKPNITSITYGKGNTFNIDIENHTYRKRTFRYYCIDINSQQIFFEKLKSEQCIASEINNYVLEKEVILQLSKAVMTPIKHKYDYGAISIGLIIGLLGGLFIGFLLGGWLLGG